MNKCCENCWKWDKWGKGCIFFWENKSICTQKQTEGERKTHREMIDNIKLGK